VSGVPVLGFDRALDGDEVLRDPVLVKIIEPTSKADALRVLAETGVESVSNRTVKRGLPLIAKPVVRQALSVACAAHAGLGPASDYQACSDKEPGPAAAPRVSPPRGASAFGLPPRCRPTRDGR
jgi:hypothetical protein